MLEHIYVLGNGFNIDLGLKVGYEDYFKSSAWTTLKQKFDAPLKNYLQESIDKNTYNIEAIFERYIQSLNSDEYAQIDATFLQALEYSFSEFVSAATFDINKNSEAYKLLCAIQQERQMAPPELCVYVYSFCYTLFDRLRFFDQPTVFEEICAACNGQIVRNQLGGIEINIDYIHGRSSGGYSKAILGLSYNNFYNSSDSILDSYSFMLKECHSHYMYCKKKYLQMSLLRAEKIVFFGFSFSKPDAPYVADWLRTLPAFEQRRDIILYVYSETDKNNILLTMETIAGDNWAAIQEKYNITFITQK